MNRIDAIAILETLAPALRSLGATSLSLYGSVSRDAARPDSDLDVFIDYDERSRFNAFDLLSIKFVIEDALDSDVDLTTRDGLHPRFRDSIQQSAVRVF